MSLHKTTVAGLALLTGLILTGCANKADPQDGAAGPGNAASPTISTVAVPGVGTSLVNSSGLTLYFADAEVGGNIRCIDPCTRFWIPLTVPDGSTPTTDATVTGTVTVITRPDGQRQVMYDNKPLYTFTQDAAPGQATGNGFTDNFDGTNFVWHAAAVTGVASAPATSPASDYDGQRYP